MTALQAAIHHKINGRTLIAAAAEADMDNGTLSAMRAGHWRAVAGRPASRLALWLGWTVAQVLEAAKTPAATCASCGQVVTTTKETPCP